MRTEACLAACAETGAGTLKQDKVMFLSGEPGIAAARLIFC